MELNPTDIRIIKFFNQGCSIERIARKIGRPNDIERVQDALKRANLTFQNLSDIIKPKEN